MSADPARLIELEERPEPEVSAPVVTPDGQDEFLLELCDLTVDKSFARRELRRCLAEVNELRRENRWEDIVALFHPVEEKCPELVAAGQALSLRSEMAFALGFLNRYEEAITAYQVCIAEDENNFQYHSGLGYTAYDSLYAAMSRQVIFHPLERKKRIELAHAHFVRAQQLRPDSVSNYYRQGMLFKQIQKKPEKGLPLFQTAIKNWRSWSEAEQQTRHQEYKNYVKSLYHAASCLQESRPREALKLLQACMAADQSKNFLSAVNKHFALGKIYFFMNDLEQARVALEAAVVLADPNNDDYVFELLGRVYLHSRNPEKAREVLNRVPGNRRRAYFRWTEADTLIALKQTVEARRLLVIAAEKDRRGKHKALMRLARLEYRDGNYQACLNNCRAANQFFQQTYQNPCDDALFWQTAALHKLGRGTDAQASLEELRIFRPGYPNLGRLEVLVEA